VVPEKEAAELENSEFRNTVNLEIGRAEKKIEQAYQELEKDRPARAMKNVKKASQHAQLAIEFAAKAE
jgi:hypothetical protein